MFINIYHLISILIGSLWREKGGMEKKCQCTSPITYGALVKLCETGELSVNAIKAHKPARLVSGHKDSRLCSEAFLIHSKHQRLQMERYGK